MRASVAVAALVATSSCDAVFGVAMPIDAAIVPEDGVTTGCTQPAVSSDFTGAPQNPCEPLGMPVGAPPTYAPIFLENGRLVIEPPPNEADANGCRNGAPIPFEHGVFMEVQSVLSHPNSFLVLTYNSPMPSTAVMAGFLATGTRIDVTGSGALQEEAVMFDNTSRWWRLRPGADAVIAEVSADGREWRRIGRVPGTPPQQIVLYIAAGIGDTFAANPGRAEIEHVNVCP